MGSTPRGNPFCEEQDLVLPSETLRSGWHGGGLRESDMTTASVKRAIRVCTGWQSKGNTERLR